MRSRALGVAAIVVGAALVYSTPAAAAPVERDVQVIELAGEVQDAGCIGPVEYLSGEVHITYREAVSAAGTVTRQYHVRLVGATAMALDTGAVYRDITHENWWAQYNPTWETSEAADGSHGAGFTYQIRMFAPGVKEAPRLTVVENFRLRRVDGYQETPTMVREDFSVTCE